MCIRDSFQPGQELVGGGVSGHRRGHHRADDRELQVGPCLGEIHVDAGHKKLDIEMFYWNRFEWLNIVTHCEGYSYINSEQK